jgi:hypothetical protein
MWRELRNAEETDSGELIVAKKADPGSIAWHKGEYRKVIYSEQST